MAHRRAERIAQYNAENAEVAARNGELPKKSREAIDALKSQIEDARIDRQAAKETITITKANVIALRDSLQIQLAAATTAPQRQVIRAQIDAAKVTLDAAQADLDMTNQTLQALLDAKAETLFQERLTKGELTADDLPRIEREKEQQARDKDDKQAWLAKHNKE